MRRKKKFLLERDIQKACVAHARKNGWWARKFSSPANRSVPDYLFAKALPRLGNAKLATEFKAPGKTSTDAQKEEQGLMRAAGWDVREIDDIDEFKRVLSVYESAWL